MAILSATLCAWLGFAPLCASMVVDVDTDVVGVGGCCCWYGVGLRMDGDSGGSCLTVWVVRRIELC